jgi:hypothetical protein
MPARVFPAQHGHSCSHTQTAYIMGGHLSLLFHRPVCGILGHLPVFIQIRVWSDRTVKVNHYDLGIEYFYPIQYQVWVEAIVFDPRTAYWTTRMLSRNKRSMCALWNIACFVLLCIILIVAF